MSVLQETEREYETGARVRSSRRLSYDIMEISSEAMRYRNTGETKLLMAGGLAGGGRLRW